MKIVIKIKDDAFDRLKRLVDADYFDHNFDGYIMKCVASGTPLPEHHGKLKDADELYSIFKENCNAYNIDNLSFISDMDMNFDLAPTIIEAEGE